MRKNIIVHDCVFPSPVFVVSTYNEDDSVNAMVAAWCMTLDYGYVALNLSDKRKTLKNMKDKGSFTISLATSEYIKDIDFLGIVSGNIDANKFDKTSFTTSKSTNVNAPIINELPVCIECEYVKYEDSEYGCGVVGKIINVSVLQSVIENDKINISLLKAVSYDPYTHGYYEVSKRVGNAYKEGLEIKNK